MQLAADLAQKSRMVSAIQLAAQIGQRIQRDLPEIAGEYRRGTLVTEIVTNHAILETYSCRNPELANRAVIFAIRGYDGGSKAQGYTGLIADSSELEELCRKHRILGGKKGGAVCRENGTGIHALSKEEKSRAGRNGVSISGRRQYEAGIGIHGLTLAQKSELGRRAVQASGLTPWAQETPEMFSELEYALRLREDPWFRYEHGQNKGKCNMYLIVNAINQLYHEGKQVRKTNAVEMAIRVYRKRLEKLVTISQARS